MYFVLDGMVYAGQDNPLGTSAREQHNRYFYEEHFCPKDVLRCEEIFGVDKEHYTECAELIKYVGEVDATRLNGNANPDTDDYIAAFSSVLSTGDLGN